MVGGNSKSFFFLLRILPYYYLCAYNDPFSKELREMIRKNLRKSGVRRLMCTAPSSK
jgi:hypothetical protein